MVEGNSPAESERALRPPRWWRSWRAFAPHAKRHRGWLFRSLGAALVLTACRLAFPWPLKAMIRPWLGLDGAAAPPSAEKIAATLWPNAAIFAGLVLILAAAEYLQRVYVAKFSIAWVRDVRAASFRAANQLDPKGVESETGDLVARLVGDTARLKAGMKGFLTHVANNGILFLGVTIVLLFIAPALGAIIAVAGVLVLLITRWGAIRVFHRYRELRRKEGKLANRIREALEHDPSEGSFANVNYSSGEHEASVVRAQSIAVVYSHVVIATATLLCLWVGSRGVAAGTMSADGLLVFVLYVLILHRRTVRLARQGTRLGKMFACGERLEAVLRVGGDAAERSRRAALGPLKRRVRLKQAVLQRDRLSGAPIELRVGVGERVALTGRPGSGKTAVLEALAGRLKFASGKLLWDEHKAHKLPLGAIAGQVAFVSARPEWLRRPLASVAGLRGSAPDAEEQALLKHLGAAGLADALPEGWRTRVAGTELSSIEARLAALAGASFGAHSLVLVDDLDDLLSAAQIAEWLRWLESQNGRTVVAAVRSEQAAGLFDRTIELPILAPAPTPAAPAPKP